MGFLSYCHSFYLNELQRLEEAAPTADSLYRARQLLRMLDDLADEGYTELNERVESSFRGISRLREYLRRNNVEPFSLPPKQTGAGDLAYSEQDYELTGAIAQAMRASSDAEEGEHLGFIEELRLFCEWIGYEEKTAYIFLLRDTLLPFVYYSARCRERIYPWLLSRSSFAQLTGRQNADDEVRASIYRALEAGYTDTQTFFGHALTDIRQTIGKYPQARAALCGMLSDIKADRVIVVESGCAGTFPLLLMALDDRVDMRMYTAYPYLAGIFGTRIFTPGYEDNRIFETMASQELYLRFSKTVDGRFYVRKCTDAAVERRSLREIGMMMK